MEFIDLDLQENNVVEIGDEATPQEIGNGSQVCEKAMKAQIEPIMIDRNSIRAETLINLIAHFYKLFKDKDVIERFETFINDCRVQAVRRININEMLIFKDLEVPDSNFDSGMGVIPNEETIIENENMDSENDLDSKDEAIEQEDMGQEPDIDSESSQDTETGKEKDEMQGSDIIVETETELKPI